MITITRRQARRLRGVFRRHVLGIAHKGAVPPLVFGADGAQLRVQHRYAALSVEHAEAGGGLSSEAVALPLDALAEFEGRDDSPVLLEAVALDRTLARWHDHGIPQVREFAVPAIDSLAPFPEPPASWAATPPDLLDALAEASDTTCEQSTRYALNCLQLRGADGEIAATDGHQLLIRSGFRLPWQESLLVRRSPIFACRALPRDRPLRLGRTPSRVAVEVGPWTIYMEVQAEGRFPVLGDVVPHPDAVTTRLRLDPDDARFLAEALDRLPGGDEPNAPATLDLNGAVAVRARGSDQAAPTELVLTRSRYTGAPARLCTNREYLGRAIRLGFVEVEVVDAGSPLACRDARRRFAWQPLSPDSAVEPAADAVRIESDTRTTPAPVRPDVPPGTRTTVREANHPSKADGRRNGDGETNHEAHQEASTVTGLAALIREAEALHEALGEARGRAGRLVVALRRQKKRDRLLSSTLASLRALKLQEVAE